MLVSGNNKQGLRLKIYHSHLKHTSYHKNITHNDRISDTPIEEKNHRSTMNEFLAHLDRKQKIEKKIKLLREKRKRICKIMNHSSEQATKFENVEVDDNIAGMLKLISNSFRNYFKQT